MTRARHPHKPQSIHHELVERLSYVSAIIRYRSVEGMQGASIVCVIVVGDESASLLRMLAVEMQSIQWKGRKSEFWAWARHLVLD